MITVSAEVNENSNKVSFDDKQRTFDRKNDEKSVDKMSQKVEPPPTSSNEVSFSSTKFLRRQPFRKI